MTALPKPGDVVYVRAVVKTVHGGATDGWLTVELPRSGTPALVGAVPLQDVRPVAQPRSQAGPRLDRLEDAVRQLGVWAWGPGQAPTFPPIQGATDERSK